MKTLPALLLTALTLAGFTACETTGDPSTGGIFWSERKAQDRLSTRERTLDSIESDTSRVRRQNTRLEGAAARRQRLLGD